MSLSRGLFTSASQSWGTPRAVYESLNQEFGPFTLDPCPLDPLGGLPMFSEDGLNRSWAGERVFCNPPYRGIGPWLAKAREPDVAVYLVPSRTDTRWWHEHSMGADEIRFLRGRLRFGDAKNSAPFPSAVLVFQTTPYCKEVMPNAATGLGQAVVQSSRRHAVTGGAHPTNTPYCKNPRHHNGFGN